MLASAFAVVTASAAISAARIVPSKIFAVVTASVSIVYTCVCNLQASPDNATAAASAINVSHTFFCLQEHYLSLTEYLHSFLVAASCANVGSKTLISLNDVPKSTSACKTTQWNIALSNFAFVIAPVVIATVPYCQL
jgi:uncharacterized membrane protein